MAFCYELESGCCGCPVRSTVCTALCHYMLYGLFVVCFVFTNVCYPNWYFPDYFFGGSGAALMVISLLTACVVDLKTYQTIRILFAFLTVLVVMTTVASTFYYTIVRWNDVAVTLIVHWLRKPPFKDFPDMFWNVLVVISCVSGPIFLFYLVYVTSFLCNAWKSHLFTSPYQNDVNFSMLPPVISIPVDTYSQRAYKPYPVQKVETNERNNN